MGGPQHPHGLGYLVEYGRRRGSFRHVFCGPPVLKGSTCPNCRKSLIQFLALDTRDPRLGLGGWRSSVVPLLFCWTCNVAQGSFSYRVGAARVRLLRYRRGGVQTGFPYADYPAEFPRAAARLRSVPRTQAETAARLNRGGEVDYTLPGWRQQDRLRHQVGGEPRLVQGHPPRRILCPLCRGAMKLFATVADDCLDPRGFAGNSFVQVVYHRCDSCRVVGCYQQCD
jgi:hypothetical protein